MPASSAPLQQLKPEPISRSWLSFLLYAVGVIGLTAGGYALFLYLLVEAFPKASTLGIVFVSVVAGIASFFNPCAFPLLPAYLAQYYTTTAQDRPESRRRDRLQAILWYGLLSAVGVIAFNAVLGAFVGTLGAGFGKSLGITGPTPNVYVRWFRGTVGAFLIILGYSHASGRGVSFAGLGHWIPRYEPSKRPSRRFFFYGFFYPLIGISCGGPILASLAFFALAAGGFAAAFSAFLIYSLVMALCMVAVSLLVGLSRDTLLKALRGSTVLVKKASGIILALVGVFLVFSAVYVKIFAKLLFPS